MSKEAVVSRTDFDPNKLTVNEFRTVAFQNGTGNFRRADIKYDGKLFVPSFPVTDMSGVFWTEPKADKNGQISGYPKPMVCKELDPANPIDKKEFMDYYDMIYCAIFRRVAVYGKVIGKTRMLGDSKYAKPELLDTYVKVDGEDSEPILVRELLRDTMTNFYEYPMIKDKEGVRDMSKKQRAMHICKKGRDTNKSNGGVDGYDCQFLPEDDGKTARKPILWENLTGNLKMSFRVNVTHIHLGSGNPSIQDNLVSATVLSRSTLGGIVGYVPSPDEGKHFLGMSEEEKAALAIVQKMMDRAKSEAAHGSGGSATGSGAGSGTAAVMPPVLKEADVVPREPFQTTQPTPQPAQIKETVMKPVPPVNNNNVQEPEPVKNVGFAGLMNLSPEIMALMTPDMARQLQMLNK